MHYIGVLGVLYCFAISHLYQIRPPEGRPHVFGDYLPVSIFFSDLSLLLCHAESQFVEHVGNVFLYLGRAIIYRLNLLSFLSVDRTLLVLLAYELIGQLHVYRFVMPYELYLFVPDGQCFCLLKAHGRIVVPEDIDHDLCFRQERSVIRLCSKFSVVSIQFGGIILLIRLYDPGAFSSLFPKLLV